MEVIASWVDSLPDDIEIAKAVIESEAADDEARTLAAVSLAYLILRMDLIPDWNEVIGVIDDAMVLRVCLELAARRNLLSVLDDDLRPHVGRLINDVDLIQQFLGPATFARLRRYCERLIDTPVHGHSPRHCAHDTAAREALYKAVRADLRMPRDGEVGQVDAQPRHRVDDGVDLDVAERKLRSYLRHKLGA
ncbi:hypothetical protein Hoch_5146 [Haliangium ochraceum DSM 14365]|uniref:DUF1232 domain-containing protein n=2 Tax=Haliangium ochraceum TaxID=80816 RepID=D0LWI4_HALO1|nr:hypothetical protein Hoch_5146 [Haliangium ochraceum DSM 14365]